MSSLTSNLYRFGEFSMNAQNRMLRRGGQAVPLTPKALDILLLLVQNAGRIVSKDELIESSLAGQLCGRVEPDTDHFHGAETAG
jgi:DNA-binding winged helix-turn-helix (wHTH) protein